MAGGRNQLAAGAILAGGGVVLGAFAAHALEARLSVDDLATFETGVRYQVWHALALLVTGVLAGRGAYGSLRLAASLFVAGVVLFSGSLYLLVLTGVRGLGMITPLGGLSFIAGWVTLLLAVLRAPSQSRS